jgi:beta-xylosidase
MIDLSKTYCNPLPIPQIQPGRQGLEKGIPRDKLWREMADPTVIKFKDKWYLFPSCGMLWYSDDMVNWVFHPIEPFDAGYAPTAVVKDDKIYLTASWEGSSIWCTDDPLGKWDCLGHVKDKNGNDYRWGDPMLFVDDDKKVYSYFNAPGKTGEIYVTLMRDDDITIIGHDPKFCFKYNPENLWERDGEFNQNYSISYTEGPWLNKYNGRYYLQYTGPATQRRNYALGCYVSNSPEGPFTYQKLNPILIHKGGIINGCGHHSAVEGPDGNLWCFYTILIRIKNRYERRIAMDPVRFDQNGEMYVDGPSERPRRLDGSYPDKVLPLSVCQPVEASSHSYGHESDYAVDNYIRTWWEADSRDNSIEWLSVDLEREYKIKSFRIIFYEGRSFPLDNSADYRYLIEGSNNNQDWQILADHSRDKFDSHIHFEEITERANYRYLRIKLLSWPKDIKPGIIDFCIFGY